MYNISNMFSKFLLDYDKSKKSKIKNLDSRINELNTKIETQGKKYNENLSLMENIKKKENELDKTYKLLIKILKSRGIIFQVNARNLIVQEWQNLYINKANGNYNLVDKESNIICEIGNNFHDFISHILKNYSYSVLVIRKDEYFITLQLRIIEK
ncbi:integrase/recombinase [Clostridium algifaecis]|uniref:Integrase/recombinase n=1 Tax=Clostridium algifaecis TaxID=1472040 RepID=A0ABS4KUH4_9CLOT|nr:hypothetical protein [Clostridium algifaecis]MBP2033690.1 integrase/recombinase [Clostridium algifaecis]